MTKVMSSSLSYNASHAVDYQAQVGQSPFQETQYGSHKELVCFGEVMYHCHSEIHHLLML